MLTKAERQAMRHAVLWWKRITPSEAAQLLDDLDAKDAVITSMVETTSALMADICDKGVAIIDKDAEIAAKDTEILRLQYNNAGLEAATDAKDAEIVRITGTVFELCNERIATNAKVEHLQTLVSLQDQLLACYRIGKRPSGKLFDSLKLTRAALAKEGAESGV